MAFRGPRPIALPEVMHVFRSLLPWFRPETILFLLLWVGLMIVGRTGMLHDSGTVWHTAVGQRILATGEFFDRDPYSFTRFGEVWAPNMWLSECVFAVLYAGGDFDLMLLFAVTLLAGLFTWVAGRLIGAGFHWLLAVVTVILVFASSAPHFHVRPHLITMVCLAIVQAALCSVEMGRQPLRRLFLLVPLFVVWANCHGGVLGGLATLGLTLFGWLALGWIGWPSPLGVAAAAQGGKSDVAGRPRPTVREALLLFGCCLATIFVGPYGAGLPMAWFRILGTGELSRVIVEHAPMDPLRPDNLLVLGFGLVYAGIVASAWPERPRMTWLMPLIWLLVATRGVRHAPLFAITAGISLADVVPHTRWARWLARVRDDLFFFPPTAPRLDWRGLVLPVVLVGLAVTLQLSGQHVPVLGRGWAIPDPAIWPVDLEADLRRFEPTAAMPRPIFNQYLQGGYLMLRHPGYRVFIDDRCELYGAPRLIDYALAEGRTRAEGRTAEDDRATAAAFERWRQAHEAWQQATGRQTGWFDLALTITDSGYDAYFQQATEAWELVRRTPFGSLYRRRGTESAPVTAP